MDNQVFNEYKLSNEIFGHSLIVVKVGLVPNPDNILISTHTLNSDNRPLSTYNYLDVRFIHILGARKW
jgi:hypothetical protein